MPKDALNRKTCACKPPKFFYDETRKCWLNEHGGEVRKGKDFTCPYCDRKLKSNGKIRHMKEDDSKAEE